MKICKIKNIEIGKGMIKICVPIVDINENDIINTAKKISIKNIDIVEFRADYYENISDVEKTIELLKKIRKILNNKVLLFTLRTQNEGGKSNISESEYEKINTEIILSNCIDIIDVQCYISKTVADNIINIAHKENIKVIGSNHDFEKTPNEYEIIEKMIYMQNMKVDIAKIAVMPQKIEDTLTLLSATYKMYSNYATIPIVTVSMDSFGVISRVCGELFGSCITFGAVDKISAKGQIELDELRYILNIINKTTTK